MNGIALNLIDFLELFMPLIIFIIITVLIVKAIKRHNAKKLELEWYKAETERLKVTGAESHAKTDET